MQLNKLDFLDDFSVTSTDVQHCFTPQVYQELRRLATQYLRAEPAGQTLTGTALVHEAFLKLNQPESIRKWNDTRHFFYSTALAMRRILVDKSRQKKSLRRGGTFRKVELDVTTKRNPKINSDSIEQLDEAMLAFEKEFPAAAELVNLWYFGGLTMSQAAGVMCISRSTAHRRWKFAKAWLARQIAVQKGNKA